MTPFALSSLLLRMLAVPALLLPALPAQARVVRVGPGDATGQGHGHGYVFGSRRDGNCWLATPAHVLRSKEGGLHGDVLRDARGRAGTASNPVQPDKSIDLAFARVSGLGGQCLDRLPARKLDALLGAGSPARLNLIDGTGGGARAMPLRIRAVDGGGQAIKFSVEPVASAMDPHPRIIQGYSGGLVDRQNAAALGHDSLPLGLVLTVCTGGAASKADLEALLNSDNPATDICTGGHYATALRFDAIRRLFERVEAQKGAASSPSGQAPHPKLLNFAGQTLEGTPQTLLTGDGCWRVKPDARGRVQLDFLLPANRISRAVIVETCEGGSNLGGVEVRGGASAGTTTAYRFCAAQGATLRCTIGARKARVIRLSVSAKDKKAPLLLRLVRIESAPI